MNIEQKVNYHLNKFPYLKKGIKRIYQGMMVLLSPKFSSEGNLSLISPNDDFEYFFGYYDKSPWDITDRYVLCMRANDTWSEVSPKQSADIILIDTDLDYSDENRVKKIAETHSWNVQQGCMLQWLGPEFDDKIIYNDFRDGKYCSIILSISTMEEKVIFKPVYSVSADGNFALSLDFSRLYNLRPGYGYFNEIEKTINQKLPNSPCIWKVDLNTGDVSEVLNYTDFARFNPRIEMKDQSAVHKVNHIMISPSGKRFMVLYRWFVGEKKYSRLITCNIDGTDMYVLLDDDMVSHCCWKDDEHILAFANKKGLGTGYYLLKDKSEGAIQYCRELTGDGHPSFSPKGDFVITDTYPNRKRISDVKLLNGEAVYTVARVYSPFKYDNENRCDLHPRWNRSGNKICIDSVFSGSRKLYSIDIGNIITKESEDHGK